MFSQFTLSTAGIAGAVRRAVLALTAVAALLVATAVTAVAAPATALQCGAVVTTDVRLSADLVDCPGDAIVAGADGITIDLGGHTVDGVGSGFGIRLGSFAGGFDDVMITNGTVTEFQNGIDLEVSHRTTVRRLHLVDNTVFGVVAGYETNGTAVEHNVIARNGFAGVRVSDAADTAVVRNTITDNVRDGVTVFDSQRTTVARNTISGHRDTGIDLWETAGDRIERNVVRDGDTDGIVADAATDAVVTGNTVTGNGFTGIEVDFGSDGTTVSGNRSLGNGRDGFAVWGAGATLVRNLAAGNGEHGFVVHFADEDPGVDGGGNRAAGNGREDCVGIVCR